MASVIRPDGLPLGRRALTRSEFAVRTFVASGVVTFVAAMAATFVLASDVYFLFFAALLLALLLRSIADTVAQQTGLGEPWAFALVLLLLAATLAAGAYLVGSTAVGQFNQLLVELPEMLDKARSLFRSSSWGRQILQEAPGTQEFVSTGAAANVVPHAARLFSTTLGALGSLLVTTFLSIYLAATPGRYLCGTLALVPPRWRPRAEQVLREIGVHLRGWLIGRLVAMAAVGLMTFAGLSILGVRHGLALSLVAALLTAIPFLGPILALIPAVLVALMQGPSMALWVLGLYLLTQAVENYLVTPLVQQDTADLPPVVAIGAITLIGALFGVLGLIVASPIAVAILVAVRMLYIEDVLQDTE